MTGLVPAIHVLEFARHQDVDARDKRGHNDSGKFDDVLSKIAGTPSGHARGQVPGDDV
jgi:hypothetical protein